MSREFDVYRVHGFYRGYFLLLFFFYVIPRNKCKLYTKTKTYASRCMYYKYIYIYFFFLWYFDDSASTRLRHKSPAYIVVRIYALFLLLKTNGLRTTKTVRYRYNNILSIIIYNNILFNWNEYLKKKKKAYIRHFWINVLRESRGTTALQPCGAQKL